MPYEVLFAAIWSAAVLGALFTILGIALLLRHFESAEAESSSRARESSAGAGQPQEGLAVTAPH